MEDLLVSLVQTPLFWESPEANRSMLEEKLTPLENETDLIILPEMFSTGFSMNARELAEPMNLTTFKWMKLMAARTGAVITGSYIVREGNDFFNRLVWMEPKGTFQVYDKRHLFRMTKEDMSYTAGKEKLVVELKGWKIMPFICYDLRFPVWMRNHYSAAEDSFLYDLAIVVANWPAPRSSAWDILLKARAVENSAIIAGVNRIGRDGNDIPYDGGSCVVDPKGTMLADLEAEESVCTVRLAMPALSSYRKKFPVHLDADNFRLL